MRRIFPLIALLALALPLPPAAVAVPLTTTYYGFDLPPDWVVVKGPSRAKGALQVLLGQKDHKCSALILVGPARPGEAEQAARVNARRLNGDAPVRRNGQWEFTFRQQGVAGYGLAREDAASGLLLLLVVSGEARRAEFVFRMRGPYKALYPRPAAQ